MTNPDQATADDLQLAGLRRLLEPFPASQIQQLPQGGIKLDYVSHGNVTKRLLEVDPFYDWQPLAFDDQGLPLFDENGGLWIRLTVLGVTRLGYGEPQGRDKYDAKKGCVSNALRNAAMRFGVALDLWARETPDADAHSHQPIKTDAQRAANPEPMSSGHKNAATDKQLKLISDLVNGATAVVVEWKENQGISTPLTSAQASELITWLKDNGYAGKPRNYLAPADPWADIPKGGTDE